MHHTSPWYQTANDSFLSTATTVPQPPSFMEILNDPPNNPLHLLDDFLATLTPVVELWTENRIGSIDVGNSSRENLSSRYEEHQDLVLRVAAELFGNDNSILEKSLSLLEEQERYQSTIRDNTFVPGDDTPVFLKIRANRSGREALLVRKQRKSKLAYHVGKNCTQLQSDKDKLDEFGQSFYLCLLGRDRSDPHVLAREKRNKSLTRIHRRGMHCTCQSFFQNLKGGKSSNILCKHLLAAILMPHMLPWSETGLKIDVVDDRKFAMVVAKLKVG